MLSQFPSLNCVILIPPQGELSRCGWSVRLGSRSKDWRSRGLAAARQTPRMIRFSRSNDQACACGTFPSGSLNQREVPQPPPWSRIDPWKLSQIILPYTSYSMCNHCTKSRAKRSKIPSRLSCSPRSLLMPCDYSLGS